MPDSPAPIRAPARLLPLALLLTIVATIPVLNAVALSAQIPLGLVPEGSLRLMIAPFSLFTHAVAGVLFGLAGPLQFLRALRHRFGSLHRVAGYGFVVAGVLLGGSGLSLIVQVDATTTTLPVVARTIAGAALIVALWLGLAARTRIRHRAWMIRAYAIGMGLGIVGLAFFPIYLITGAPPSGLGADILFVLCWGFSIVGAEIIIRRLGPIP
ncbi:MAG: DUF2306 domain-containing protein [Paracoccaceae bacterium]